MERKVVCRNVITSLILQIVTIIGGFITPKIILSHFGSEVNGLLSSITQFLNYIQLIEGGLGSVVLAALYKPLSENDNKKINAVLNTSRAFFRKIASIYIIYTVLVAIIYPLCIQSPFNYGYTVCLVFVLAENLFIQYFFSISYKLLLNADRRVYFTSIVQIVVITINTLSVIVCAHYFNDVLIIKLVSALVFFITPIAYNRYVNKHYNIDIKVPKDKETLSQRWDGFGINIAYFIHSNTDIVVITFFLTLSNVSIYAVYAMIVRAIKNLVDSISGAIVPSFGKTLAEGDHNAINRRFDLYEYGITFISVIVFTCGMILITPFVRVYTQNITDADYYQPLFGVLITCAEMIYCIRGPYVSAAYSAGHFKQISKYAYFEAGINIILSMIMVRPLGLVGVAIGTVFGMVYRMIMQVYYIKNNIVYRPVQKCIKQIVYTLIITIPSVFLFRNIIEHNTTSYYEWAKSGVIVFALVFGFSVILSVILYRNEFMHIIGNKVIYAIKKHN